jgi:RNA polymerase sigma-70 factor, ECF subfamily
MLEHARNESCHPDAEADAESSALICSAAKNPNENRLAICLLYDRRLMLQTITDEEVICRIRNGDTKSYEVLASRYHRPLHRVARRLLRSEADAEDAVQGAHLRALTRIDQYAGAGYFRWMYSIVVNEALTQMRKRRRLVGIGDFHAEHLSSQVRGPEEQVIEQNAEDILERAVQTLPVFYQPVFRLREMQDLTTAETGERLGLSKACVKSRLLRAKKMVRKRLRQTLQFRSRKLPGPIDVKRGSFPC